MGEVETWLKRQVAVQDAVVLSRDSDNTSDKQSEADALIRRLSSLGETEANRLLVDVETLSQAEIEFLLVHEKNSEERKNTMIRKFSEFEIFLRLRDGEFIRPPQENQKHWILHRALEEFTDDLRYSGEVSRRFVGGSERTCMQNEWSKSDAQYDGSQLVIEGQQVMQDWERPLMKAMASIVGETHGDILEVGFGMGISATYIQEHDIRSYTVIETNDDVVGEFQKWKRQYPQNDIRLVHGKWQDVIDQLDTYDGIFFDTYPLDEDEFQNAILDGITFAEPFIPSAAVLLRSGGVFTYFTTEIDSLSRRHQRLIFKYFELC